jgi:hypothetical protein
MAKTKSKDDNSTICFETFKKIGAYEQSILEKKDATCFNGEVNIHKYKVTVEPIEEPKEVLAERLQKLWDECDNHHHWNPLQEAAEEIGYELKGSFGSLRKKKYQ